jgi:putative transposase
MSRIMTYYRRHLPHWHPLGLDLFVTWRLKGSLPTHLQGLASQDLPGKRFVELDRALDLAEAGPQRLRDPRVAESVIAALAGAHSRNMLVLHAYVLMANHVHTLFTPLAALPQITGQIKGSTARAANLILGRTGALFWQDESFDHWVRDPAEWQKIRNYIERNPVAAGLASRPEEWPWSSASRPIER